MHDREENPSFYNSFIVLISHLILVVVLTPWKRKKRGGAANAPQSRSMYAEGVEEEDRNSKRLRAEGIIGVKSFSMFYRI